jgi:type II secretion system protein C
VRDAVVGRRWSTLAQWALVATTAYAAALVLNTGVRYWLDAGTGPAPTAPTGAYASRPSAQPARLRDDTVIFQRNLFGDQPQAVRASLDVAPTSQGPGELRLIGTADVDGRGYAAIENVSDKRQEIFEVGETVFAGPTLAKVGPGRALLDWHGRTQMLEIVAPEPETSPSSKKLRTSATGSDSEPKTSDGSIRQTGANAYLVDRREVEHSIDNLNQIATQMRAVPFVRDGQTLGFRVLNIHANSIFERMGLKNGDVIQRVNGVELDSPTKALALLEDVQTAQEIRVDLLRDNQPNSLNYTVR